MYYLWGDWLRRAKLLAEKPDKKNMSPIVEKVKMLHSVPVVNINVRSNKKIGYQANDKTQINILSARFAVSELTQRSVRSGTPPAITSNGENGIDQQNSKSPETQTVKVNKGLFGAQSEQECRKLINDFNLLLVNRKMSQKVLAKDVKETKFEEHSKKDLKDRPQLSNKSASLAKKRKLSSIRSSEYVAQSEVSKQSSVSDLVMQSVMSSTK